MMSEYMLGIAGIAVSVGLFLLGYRQTIGAKKERVRSANDETEKILVRRIVLEEYTPGVQDITRLIDGKARDFRVRTSDLLSEGQLLNNVFTRVLETDFIPRDQRDKVLRRLEAAIRQVEEEPLPEDIREQLPSDLRSKRMATIMMAIMGAAASLLGGLLTALPEIAGLEVRFVELLPAVIMTAAASLAVIGFLIVFYRVREQQQGEPSKSAKLADYVEFERDVMKVIAGAGLATGAAGARDQRFDFVIERGGRKIIIEVKDWRGPVPASIVSVFLDRLRQAVSQESASEAILVTRTSVPVPKNLREDERVKLMTLRELRNYLDPRRATDESLPD